MELSGNQPRRVGRRGSVGKDALTEWISHRNQVNINQSSDTTAIIHQFSTCLQSPISTSHPDSDNLRSPPLAAAGCANSFLIALMTLYTLARIGRARGSQDSNDGRSTFVFAQQYDGSRRVGKKTVADE